MTIKEAAEKYGISSQAIYQRLKKQKISVKTLQEKGTGQLTADAEAVLEKLFAQQSNKPKTSLQSENASLRALVESQAREIALLTARIEALERERGTLSSTLEVERALFARYLPPARQSIFDRLFRKK